MADALCEIDDRIKDRAIEDKTGGQIALPEARLSMAEAFHSPREEVPLRDAAGRIAADFLMLYPPGIPLAAPGELLHDKLIAKIADSREKGLSVQGVSPDGRIGVVVEIPAKIWHDKCGKNF